MAAVFRAEFQPEAIALNVATYPSPAGYLRRLYADVRTELEQVDESSRDAIPYVRQFAPARAAECYAAINAIQAVAADLGITDLHGPPVDWTLEPA
jgi:hypothetical protein